MRSTGPHCFLLGAVGNSHAISSIAFHLSSHLIRRAMLIHEYLLGRGSVFLVLHLLESNTPKRTAQQHLTAINIWFKISQPITSSSRQNVHS